MVVAAYAAPSVLDFSNLWLPETVIYDHDYHHDISSEIIHHTPTIIHDDSDLLYPHHYHHGDYLWR